MYRSSVFVLLLITLTSCQQDIFFEQPTDEPVEQVNSDIPKVLLPYFNSFKAEAEKLGYQVDFEAANLTAEIQQINEGSVAGTCSTNGHNSRHITIDQNFWNTASHLVKEMVVYHELGHCILGRGHTETAFDNGICRSIMRSGLGECRDAYTNQNRDYFVQELFSEQGDLATP